MGASKNFFRKQRVSKFRLKVNVVPSEITLFQLIPAIFAFRCVSKQSVRIYEFCFYYVHNAGLISREWSRWKSPEKLLRHAESATRSCGITALKFLDPALCNNGFNGQLGE